MVAEPRSRVSSKSRGTMPILIMDGPSGRFCGKNVDRSSSSGSWKMRKREMVEAVTVDVVVIVVIVRSDFRQRSKIAMIS